MTLYILLKRSRWILIAQKMVITNHLVLLIVVLKLSSKLFISHLSETFHVIVIFFTG